MFGHYVISREKFNRWLAETPLFKPVHDGGYARVDQRRLILDEELVRGPEAGDPVRQIRYTVRIEGNGGERRSASSLALCFPPENDGYLEQPFLQMLVEELRVEGPAPSADRRIGPTPTPPKWNVLDKATEENRATADKDRALLRLAAREILTAIEQLQEHKLP